MLTIRRVTYFVVFLAYHYVYAPIMDTIERYQHRNDPPLPPVPCQICGKPGHREKYCPNAKGLGF
jgi:hypothetical protein